MTKAEQAAIVRYVVGHEMGYAVLFKDKAVAEKYGFVGANHALTRKAALIVDAHRFSLQTRATEGQELAPNERYYLQKLARRR